MGRDSGSKRSCHSFDVGKQKKPTNNFFSLIAVGGGGNFGRTVSDTLAAFALPDQYTILVVQRKIVGLLFLVVSILESEPTR